MVTESKIANYLNNIIVKVRKDPAYRVDERLSAMSALSIAARRMETLTRGTVRRRMLRSSGKNLFVGRGVRIFHPRMVVVGDGCVLGDHVMIDGLSADGIIIGDNVTLDRFSAIRATGSIRHLGIGARIGNNSALGAFSYIGAAGGVEIGDDVWMGSFVGMYAENHIFKDTEMLIREQGTTREGIRIGNDCWIGSGVTILGGVTIGNGCVIGAGSVVTGDIEPLSVAVGVPAKVIKKRD